MWRRSTRPGVLFLTQVISVHGASIVAENELSEFEGNGWVSILAPTAFWLLLATSCFFGVGSHGCT
jgi:hypothetical protein